MGEKSLPSSTARSSTSEWGSYSEVTEDALPAIANHQHDVFGVSGRIERERSVALVVHVDVKLRITLSPLFLLLCVCSIMMGWRPYVRGAGI